MLEVRETDTYARWFVSLRDERAKARIVARIRRLSLGHFGDAKTLGAGFGELRVDYGPGYRIYFARRGDTLVLLISGGDKSRQKADIERARALAARWELDDGD